MFYIFYIEALRTFIIVHPKNNQMFKGEYFVIQSNRDMNDVDVVSNNSKKKKPFPDLCH